jgi:hypothetical protein
LERADDIPIFVFLSFSNGENFKLFIVMPLLPAFEGKKRCIPIIQCLTFLFAEKVNHGYAESKVHSN